jgi:hypothetical protein
MGDFDLSSQLADILNEPLFEALDSNRQLASTDMDSLPMGDIELDFGFGEVDLQKIMEEEMGSKKLPPRPSLDTRTPLPPPAVDHPPASSTALMNSQSGSSVPGAAFASTLSAASTSAFALDEEDDATQAAADGGDDDEHQQQTSEKKEEDGDSVCGGDGDDVLVEAELTSEHSLIKEITDTIEGRYLESLNELKLRELVRREELGGGSDADSSANKPAAQEDYPHGQETSEEAMHELEEELGKASPDLDHLRQLGRSYIIPESVRPALWKVRLDLLSLTAPPPGQRSAALLFVG